MAERYVVPISFPCRIPEHTQTKCGHQDLRISADVRCRRPQFLAETTLYYLKTTAGSIFRNMTVLAEVDVVLECDMIVS